MLRIYVDIAKIVWYGLIKISFLMIK